MVLDHVSLEQACRSITVHRLTKTPSSIIGHRLYKSELKFSNPKCLSVVHGIITSQDTQHLDIIKSYSFSTVPQVLHCCVSGSTLHTQQSHYLLSLSDLSTDYDLMLGQVKSFEPPPTQTNTNDFGNLLTVAEGKEKWARLICVHSGRAGAI